VDTTVVLKFSLLEFTVQLLASEDVPRRMFKVNKHSWSAQPMYIHPEDGNSNVCRNVGYPSTFDAAHPPKPK
jgi:hypothetical protein